MYQPAHLDSFLRLLVTHLETMLTQGEQIIEKQALKGDLALLQEVLEPQEGFADAQTAEQELRDKEALFVLQVRQSREWVDRLGQFDPVVERDVDEYLAATYQINRVLLEFDRPKADCGQKSPLATLEHRQRLPEGLQGQVNISSLLNATYELLGRLEEHYGLLEDLLEVPQAVNEPALEASHRHDSTAKIIPLVFST